MKLWLLDADVIIDLLSVGVFDNLVGRHEIYAASTVIEEVRYFKKAGEKLSINFRNEYVVKGIVKEISASVEELKEVRSKLPSLRRESIDDGELESIAVLIKNEDLKFCCCDVAAIRALPFFDLSDRALCVETLLKQSGLTIKLEKKHSQDFFSENLKIGGEIKALHFKA